MAIDILRSLEKVAMDERDWHAASIYGNLWRWLAGKRTNI
jgi:hypothetical protein